MVAQEGTGGRRLPSIGRPNALLAKAKQAHGAGRVDVAEGLYTRVIRTDPSDAIEAYRCLAILCAQTNRLSEAIEYLTAALLLAPGDAALLNDLGTLYQSANRAEDAIAAYRQAVAQRPDFAAAHLHLGTALHREGRLAEAVDCYRRAIAIAPKAPDSHLNLGVVLQQLGNHGEAEAAFRQALAIEPRAFAAHFNLGISLAAQGQADAAIAAYRAALAVEPSAAPVHVNLGMALEQKGDIEAAIGCYRRAIALDPALAKAFFNLGCALYILGRPEEAIEAYRAALRIDPTDLRVSIELGAALQQQHRLEDALFCYRGAVALHPESPLAHRALAVGLRDHGLLDEAFASFRRHAELAFRTLRRPTDSPVPLHKTKHDLEQLDYLADHRLLAAAASLREEVARAPFSPVLLEQRFSALFHIEGGARIETAALGARADALEIETRWAESRPKIVVVDDLLSASALHELRRFCWGSTIWRNEYRDGYLGSMMESGFAQPLILQISSELAAAFPSIFRGHPLLEAWAFKYDSALRGIGVHADFAAVNVNFWITADEANLDAERGGLVIWDQPAPLDWDFATYNKEVGAIRDFLAHSRAKAVTVPYRANRAVIFDSDLFHETDRIAFKEGYLNRRINVTLLYGRREHAAAQPTPADASH